MGQLQCVYASCDDIPEYGCIYPDADLKDLMLQHEYGGIPCGESSGDVSDVLTQMLLTIIQQQQ